MVNSGFGMELDDDKPDPKRRPKDFRRGITDPSNQAVHTTKHARRSPYASPHDAVLAEMRGQPVRKFGDGGDDDDADDMLPSNDFLPQVNEESIDGPSTTPGSFSTTNDIHLTNHTEILHDPFDGSPIGLLVPIETHPQATRQHPGPYISNNKAYVRESSNKGEDLWTHLSRVLELQNQVAKVHLEMESVGPGKTGDGKGKGASKGKGGLGGRDQREWPGRKSGAGADVPEGDEEGVGIAGDEEAEIQKAREEEFANLADQFEGRKDSINEIMGKLDDLSKALTEFHALREPKIEFPKSMSRHNSTTPDDTPPAIHIAKPSPSPLAHLPSAPPTLPGTGAPAPHQNLPPHLPPTAQLPNRKESIIPVSLSRSAPSPLKTRTPVPPLIIHGMEPWKQTHVMDSPASTVGSLKLSSE